MLVLPWKQTVGPGEDLLVGMPEKLLGLSNFREQERSGEVGGGLSQGRLMLPNRLMFWLAAVLCQFSWFRPSPTEAQELVREPTEMVWLETLVSPLSRNDLPLQSAASCAATACHGGARPGIGDPYAARGAEYPLWLERDPHANSWRTMCGQAASEMMHRLGILHNGQLRDQAGFDNCLKCHNTTPRFAAGRTREFHSEGVGCAACHGPAELWQRDHVRLRWNESTSVALGKTPTKNLAARARMCASCHVGDADRDMNHDMIAAGHPALHYEFSAYHARLPKHWREPEFQSDANFEAQLWLAGQIAATDAFLSLLESRAAGRLPASQWPEFSSYDCSSCHQSFRPSSLEPTTRPAASAARYSQWNQFGINYWLAEAEQHRTEVEVAELANKLSGALRHVEQVMIARPIPDTDQTRQAVESARRALDEWLQASGHATRPEITARQLQLLTAVAAADERTSSSWESLAQCYLAAVASRSAWLTPQAPALSPASRLRTTLLFKPGTSSADILDPGERLESPSGLAQELANALRLDTGDYPKPPDVRFEHDVQ